MKQPLFPRCETSTSSPGISHSIGEGIIEEEDEDVEVESNKKRMKEDDQEVLTVFILTFFRSMHTCIYVGQWSEILERFYFLHTDKEGKHLHMASGVGKDRKILGRLV